MKGLLINACHADLPKFPSSFAIFFQPILPKLTDYYWSYVFISIPESAPQEISDSYLKLYQEVHSLPYIPPNTYLPKYADYVYDRDWHDFLGYLTLPTSGKLIYGPHEPYEAYYEKKIDLEPLPEPDIAFDCIDGWPQWTIHAKDESLLEEVRLHASQLPGVTIETIEDDSWMQPKSE
jgi:hypothetical protein